MMHGYEYGGMMGGFSLVGYIMHLVLTGVVVYFTACLH